MLSIASSSSPRAHNILLDKMSALKKRAHLFATSQSNPSAFMYDINQIVDVE
jgi:hypothetical protein